MASIKNHAVSASPPPLKAKLDHIKDLLDDANLRLRQEADIFTTKASASPPNQNGRGPNNVNQKHLPPLELRRTIADISTIQSVLSCPIFNQIANVTDSLDKLSYHLNLRPSIGPTDIDFDDNGELILAPPMEATSLNNLINSRLDDYTNSPAQQSELSHFNLNVTNGQDLHDQHQFNDKHHHHNHHHQQQQQQQQLQKQQQQNKSSYYNEFANFANQENGNVNVIKHGSEMHDQREMLAEKTVNVQHQQQAISSHSAGQPQQLTSNAYDTERLVVNGNEMDYVNGSRQRRREPTKVQSVVAVLDNAAAMAVSVNQTRRLYKANGHSALNQVASEGRNDFEINQSVNYNNEHSMAYNDEPQSLGYTNDMYKAAHEISSADRLSKNASYEAQVQQVGIYANGSAQQKVRQSDLINTTNGKSLNGKILNNQRASPSTSAGSTVRLADECDSGTSSFRSKGALYSPQSQRPIEQLEDPTDSSIDQELIEKLSPEMERIKVTLEKDAGGLGITIAGYTCEQEEISGIFIKSISPGSPADRSGKIKILDQIFAVNGQEILAYSNPEAVNVLRRQTSRVVTLELMRHLAESKYKRLQTLLEFAEPTSALQKSTSLDKSPMPMDIEVHSTKAQPVVSTSSPKRYEHLQPVESVYNNTSAPMEQRSRNDGFSATSPTPVAAQRFGTTTSKVIETKQGARNKIDIRSPLCQTASPKATYVNEVPPSEINSNTSNVKSITDRLRQEVADEFSRLVSTEKLEWEKSVQIVELRRDSAQSLGFTVKDYANPKDPQRSIFMIVSIAPGSIADIDGQLSVGDLLVFVDDTNLENSTPSEAVKALRRTSGQVRLGILKYKQN